MNNTGKKDLEYIYRKEIAEKRFQICEPTKKRERETRVLIQKNLNKYLNSIDKGGVKVETLNYIQQLESDKKEEQSKVFRQYNKNLRDKDEIMTIASVLNSNDYQEVYHNKMAMPFTNEMLAKRVLQEKMF